ncbi:CDP-diacylglycerol-inositol 3-phosphatidyltransferase [Verticillium alfalfae VaMs.102]|uniref:CDP-diacylglycerol-inositol 3-phosphatidyltransferase n=1 Tax=Verticillium alfalfae (strain VaMs.102 / ATCC MYA-4576 / FGSC 10136) TaxID=526221 RepID=C9SKN7_VERA1|nr:CDP-diacylglycerol-inositol 3-phosphatidyltransferase [Verticillium alfalfae VaMs.102]EEY19255.1 CDP-diacylglycerol-inositol 3-phosphatidyltransferase [Verticillium alfalfae VaMs.102]
MSSSTRSSKKSSSSSSKVSRKASPEQQPLVNGNGNASAKSSSNGTAATAASSTAVVEEENIFVFYPNIIGYVRIVLAIASLYYMPLHPRTCSLLYSVSCLLDALDGYAARIFDQSTRFGAVLDMVTDRCTTSCLLMFLACAFPRWTIVFQLLITLDFASHYMHMYASLTMGGAGTSHKNVDKERNWMLNLYYTNKTVLFVFCALNELFFIALYLLSFSSPLLSPSLLKSVGETGAAALELARRQQGWTRSGPGPQPASAFPVMAAKQFINVAQLVNASKWLGRGQPAGKAEQGLPKKKKRLELCLTWP